jgi:hypothetical protein
MPLIVALLFLPFAIGIWILRYFFRERSAAERARVEERRLEVERLMARPLQEYVRSREPVQRERIKLVPASTPPTLGNIGRFAALSLKSHAREYYVKAADEQVYGPATEETILEWILEGRLQADALTSISEQGPWIPAKDVRSLKPAFKESHALAGSRQRFNNLKIDSR